jgi:ESCO1/2 acetyl-transferase
LLQSETLYTEEIPYTAFLCVNNNRVVAVVLVEEIKKAYPLIMTEDTRNDGASGNPTNDRMMMTSLRRSLYAQRAMLGVYLLWVHDKFRRTGIANQLIDVARDRMVYGFHVPIDQIAFSSPTQAGLSFALKYCKTIQNVQNANEDANQAIQKSNKEACVLVYDCGIRNSKKKCDMNENLGDV